MNRTVQREQPELWALFGILLLFLAFGLLPFVPEIRLFNIVWTALFAFAGIGVLCYPFLRFSFS